MFRPSQRMAIVISNLGIGGMLCILYHTAITTGFAQLMKIYGVPWLGMNHWIIMLTFLQHTDPEIPIYRKEAWTYTRGTVNGVDRNFMGSVGSFFFHDISHCHIVHHMFPSMPFYNGKEATVYIKACIGDDYHYSDKPVWRALWDNFATCWYVDDVGDVVYYRNR